MNLSQQKIEEIVALVRRRFPDWAGFSDPDFEADEIDYKQATIAKARDLLSEVELQRLISEGRFDEFIERLDTIGKDNNLLWRRVPMSGDLGILYQPTLDKPTFCQAVFDLLYGPGPSHERLWRYTDYVKAHNLPNKWTFPTYFLFICHPDSEIFVKPQTTKWFLQFSGGPRTFTSVPTPPTYATILQMAQQLMDGLQAYEPRDMVDIQSLIWVCARVGRGSTTDLLAKQRRAEFVDLFEEFLSSYLSTPDGQDHLAAYKRGREQARQNYEAIVAAAERGEDITDLVLLKLLPHADNAANREKGAWTHIAPAITGDLKAWFEGAGWTQPEDWPRIAQAILQFVRRCYENPGQLAAACAEFSDLPYSKGFQTGMLTPILNALRPDEFILINNKSRRVINYLANTSHGQKLAGYPATNATAQRLIKEVSEEMHQLDAPEMPDEDLFDMFSSWLVGIKHYNFRGARYWKIAPGENAWNWEACRDGGFIAIGWEELGDISGLSQAEFNARRDELVARKSDWTEAGVNQVWRFAHIREGDRIVANRGTTEVLGIGTVTGPYYFVPDKRHGHRLPVEWDDLKPRRVDERGWRMTLAQLDEDRFEQITQAPLLETLTGLGEPFSRIFQDREEAEWAFALLRETLDRLGVADPDDERFALTFRHGQRLLRLNFGNWAILHFADPSQEYRVGMTLIEQTLDSLKDVPQSGPFAQSDLTIRIYELPMEEVRPLKGGLRQVYEETLDYVAERFRDWIRSNYRKYNQPRVAAAVFDLEEQDRLLDQGLSREAQQPEEPDEEEILPVAEDGYFSNKTFELLADLHANPNKEFYMSRREEFKAHLESPFQQLLRDVATQLPPTITEFVETERSLFSRILKNDFGRGGAWDYYWGAFYPKGSKRTADAQLSLWINHERLECGFYIGDYGTAQRQRFLRNCREHQSTLVRLLGDILSTDLIIFGSRDHYTVGPDGSITGGMTWEKWLQDPERGDYDASVIFPRTQVLGTSAEQLSAQIAQIYEQIFPLFLLATLDDPLPAIREYLEIEEIEPNPPYSLAQCAEETGLNEETITRWIRAIERKGQAIVYGPPGTGKTYVAERLARHMVGGGDGFVELVQFHPAYAYEDFIQGIRPQRRPEGGLDYAVVPGRFLEFCRQARTRQDRCVLIVDEINRANLARVFGELMYLLEYRDREVPLAAGGRFRIPANVRIIGTMNTADRSIALVDHALRRRFAFLALYPKYNVLRRFHQTTGFAIEGLIETLQRLNREIGDRHYEVGISFFLRENLAEQIADVWQMEIEPYLEEYFFDQPGKVERFRWNRVADKILPESEQ